MEEKLELKHLAPYLPYKLMIKSKTHTYELDGSMLSEHGGINGYKNIFKFNFWGEKDKPLLHPLDRLTEPILEGGETMCRKLNWEEINVVYWLGKDPKDYMDAIIRPFERDILFENHFDVFGLIEKGLALPIDPK